MRRRYRVASSLQRVATKPRTGIEPNALSLSACNTSIAHRSCYVKFYLKVPPERIELPYSGLEDHRVSTTLRRHVMHYSKVAELCQVLTNFTY